jgi:hypothetical protein
MLALRLETKNAQINAADPIDLRIRGDMVNSPVLDLTLIKCPRETRSQCDPNSANV